MIGTNATVPVTTCKDAFLYSCDMLFMDPDKVHDAFRALGPGFLKPQYQAAWSSARPTTNFCYIAAEYVYWYRMKEYIPRICSIPNGKSFSRVGVYHTFIPSKGVTHWFTTYWHYNCNTYVYDLTADQFDDYDEYVRCCESAKRGFFFQSGFVGPSKRAQNLAHMLGHEIDEWCYSKIPDRP